MSFRKSYMSSISPLTPFCDTGNSVTWDLTLENGINFTFEIVVISRDSRPDITWCLFQPGWNATRNGRATRIGAYTTRLIYTRIHKRGEEWSRVAALAMCPVRAILAASIAVSTLQASVWACTQTSDRKRPAPGGALLLGHMDELTSPL